MPIWTEAQERAIYSQSGEGNILVSAAAGSGKTAVLVERIVNMITRAENPVSIDSLLVVTFTEAAASEMRERIIARINKAYREAVMSGDREKSAYLRGQIHLTSGADINTIDSFCLNVVKNNFHILGADPNFSIMDKHEGDMLADDTLSELFLSLYASEDAEERDSFTRLVNIYASNRDDEGLKSVVRKVYGFIQSFPEPLEWLEEKAAMYSEDMADSEWVNKIFLRGHTGYIVKKHESFWNELIRKMSERADGEDGAQYWGKLWKNVCACRDAVSALKKARGWDDIYAFYKSYIEKKSFLGSAINAIPAKKLASDEDWQRFYDEYNYMRDDLREECMKLPCSSREDFNEYVHSKELKRSVDDLARLVKKFSECFEEKKNSRNCKSFSDIEHLAYRLFSENENIREEYAGRYEEILIDEYQDTNGLQDAIFTSISREGKNMFMVGDLKQSIYRFRGGDPMIFKNKSLIYGEGKGGNKITLSQNFRSRKEVLAGINSVFSAVMSDGVGDVEYCGGEVLQRDNDRECYIDGANLENKENNISGYSCELYKIAVIKEDGENGGDISSAEAEAACIAERIRSLCDGRFQVYAGDGKYRDIEYRDIVILMRSVKRSGDITCEMLEKRGIPAFVQKEEYFERREIKLMLSLISLINNHMQDIPLTAVMRSPIGGFSENELALIKIDYSGRSFYKAVKSYKAGEKNLTENEERLRGKCRRFIADLDRWRGYVKMKSIASLIWTLYEETGFYDFMGALEGGEEAQANLKLLYERAKKYEESGFKGIFNFIRYIERIENRNDDISGAKLINENHNVVRIMTIHKSKGLEFPVVFLAGTTKKLISSRAAGENRVLLHKDYGIGADYYNYEDMYCKKLMFNKYIEEENKKESLSEEMRLMYVAMTRAREKLIVTAAKTYKTARDCEAVLSEQKCVCDESKLRHIVSPSAKCYADWIIPAVNHDGAFWKCFEKTVSSLEFEDDTETEQEEIKIENYEEVRDSVRKILEFRYAYPKSGAIPAKTSVTAIKEMEDAEHTRADSPVYMTQKPKFMRPQKLGAQIGTAHHQVMAYIDMEKIRGAKEDSYEKIIMSEIERIAEEEQLDADIAADEKIVSDMCSNISGFFRNDMGKNLLNAKNLYRERSFEIEIPASEYDGNLGSEYDDEKIVVQGIIDLYFENESGDITLVDYKTDRCKTQEEQLAVAQKYRKQLELYERAMEKILKKSVKDKYLYLFSAQNVVKLD